MARHKMIVNPTSGRGAGGESIPVLEAGLKQAGLAYDLVQTERPWHAAQLAQQAAQEGFEDVVAVGGDGTANEVLNGLMLAREANPRLRPVMGIVSVGRGNDFAFGVGVPHGAPAGLIALAGGRRMPLDVGRVSGGLYPQGRYFGNGVGIGFDAVVGFEAVKLKHLTGFPSYIVAALRTIFLYFRAPRVRVETDSGPLELSALMVSVMNGRRMGGGFMMAPNALTDDGLFDLCIARQVSKAGIFALIPRFMKGTQGTHPAIVTGRTTRITVTALEGVLPAHADGETLSTEGTKLTIEILPRPLEIITMPAGGAA
jgi:diacylglycerol kinase (ATP)